MSWPGGEYLGITVYVYDASNMTPIPYATVTVRDIEGYVSGIQGTTGPNGYVSLKVPLVIGDTYYITASANGYKSNTVSYVSFQLEELSHVSIGLTPTQWTPGPSPTPPSGGNYLTVTVYVYDVSNNSPIPGATVTITDSQGYVSGLQGTTGSDGYVVFSNVPYYPNDTYYITAKQINYNSNTVSYTGQQLASLKQVNIGLTSIFTTQPTGQPSAPSLLGKGTTIALIGVVVATAGVAAYAVASRRKK